MKNETCTFWQILSALMISLCLAFPALSREPTKPVSGNPKAQEWLDKAWAALDQQMTIPEIDEAIACLEKAVALDPQNPGILVELADEYYQRGDQMPHGTDKEIETRKEWFLKGLETARKALALAETPGAHYWTAVNMAAAAEHDSIFKRASLYRKLDAHMDWIEEHDRDYKYGALARFWSRVVTRVPGVVVKMVGEDPTRIFESLEEAIRSEPRFLDNYVYKADFYRHMGKEQDALKALDQVLRMDPEAFPQERAYNRYAQKRARALWQQLTGNEYPKQKGP